MNANELRIGNIVSTYGTNGCPDGWVEIDASAESIKTCVSHPDWFKGVEITEDRLLKFGFKKNNHPTIKQYLYNDITVEFADDGVSVSPKDSYWIDIKYVHQLQNSCFVFDGVELETVS